MICEFCKSENPDGSVYCKECGKRIDGKVPCPVCGQYTLKGEYCGICGAPMDGKVTCKCGTIYKGKYCPNCGMPAPVYKNVSANAYNRATPPQ